MKSVLSFLLATTALVTGGEVAARTDRFDVATAAVAELAGATRGTPGAAPALAVVMAAPGRTPVVYVDGVADTRTGAAAGPDTPFYIASMTKAYVGLMAAELDRRGVFDLDASLTDVWPDLTIQGAEPSTITFRQLLSHQAAIENDPLTFRTAYTDEVPAGDYDEMLAMWTRPRETGFRYDNLGYLIYGAALEVRTGRHWRTWLDEIILQPLAMNRTAASVSRLPGVAAAGQWTGEQWISTDVKADSLMHAAGGLMASPADLGRWLQANVEEQAVELPAAAFQVAHRSQIAVVADQDGIPCDGYALGWRTCALKGAPFLLHGGGYTGARSQMAVAPGLGVGIAVVANSETMTGYLASRLVETFITLMADPDASAPDVATFAADYADKVATQTRGRRKQLADRRAEAQWAGWMWRPDAAVLQAYVGRYRSAELGEAEVLLKDGSLILRLGEMAVSLEPAVSDLFGASADVLDRPDPVRFERTGRGVTAVDWDGDRFERLP